METYSDLPFVGSGSREKLCDAFLHEGQFLCVAVRNDGTIAFITEGVREELGYDPTDLVGTSILELIHPSEVERAIQQLGSAIGGAVLSGITRFQVLRKDGTYGALEVFGGPVSDGVEEYIGIYGRSPLHQVVVEDILSMLLRGLPLIEVLQPVSEVIQWREHASHFSIAWEDDHGIHQVGSGISPLVGGGDPQAGSPWAAARDASPGVLGGSDGGVVFSREGSVADLSPELAAVATAAGVALYWIEGVAWSELRPPAVLTVWTVGGRIVPSVHQYGMAVARDMVRLILGWTEQAEETSRAARVDALTGLANRRAFFAALHKQETGGALLYCDLDRFKPVNDTFGHAAGDILLRLVAQRIEACVREGDVVARLGGDEFAVLCTGATDAQADEVASRIHGAVEEPFVVEGNEVRIGVSIGIAAEAGRLDDAVLSQADLALYRAKGARR